MNMTTSLENIPFKILWVREHKVIIDTDLAALYGVTTKVLNQAVKRHQSRFPDDFMFRLTAAEKNKVVTGCDHLRKLKFSSTLPYAFTEHGAIMLASLLNSPAAIQASIQVVRAFVRLRELLASHKDLAKKLEGLEHKYDHHFKIVFDTIRQLMTAPRIKTPRIGFR